MKKGTCILSLLLVLALMLPLAAQAESAVTYPLEEGITITIARQLDVDLPTAGFTTYNDTPGIKALEAATGVNLEFIEPADDTAFLLYVASGNLADVIIGGTSFYPGGISAMVAEGLAIDLTELLPVYAPDYWALVNGVPAYLSSVREPDGRFYNFGGYFHKEGSAFRSWIGLVARQELLDQLGMEAPTTLDEMYDYLYRLKHELGMETPFMSDKQRTDHLFAFGGALTSPFGLPTTGLYHVDGQVHYGAFEPEYKEFLTWMNKLYADGLMDPNFAVTDEATAHAAFLSGQSGLIYTAASRVNTLTQAAESDEFTLVGLSSLKTADGGTPLFSYMDSYVGGAPTLAEFVTNNPDGQSLDGLLRAYGLLNFPIVQQPEMCAQRFPLPQQRQAIEAWAVGDTDKYKVANTSIAAEYADEYAGLFTDIDTYVKEARAQMISGSMSIDDFDTVYIPTLQKMGIERLVEIYQLSYEMYNAN